MGVSPLLPIFLNILDEIASMTAGIAMLKGLKWGRQLYLIITPIFILAHLLLFGLSILGVLLFGIVIYALFFAMLTRGASSVYFSDSEDAAVIPPGGLPKSPTHEPLSGKKIASIILLLIGGSILIGWMMMVPGLADNLLTLTFFSVLLGGLACATIIPAVFLWDRKRWVMILGVLLTSVSAFQLMTSLLLYQFTSLEGFRDLFAKLDPETMQQMIWASLISGIVAAVIGVPLIILQRENDKWSRPDPLNP